MAGFCAAMEQELRLYRQVDGLGARPVTTIYLGGGTPTVLPEETLIGFLTSARATWPVDSGAEITVEAHPSTVTEHELRRLRAAGLTRLSMGAESMNQADFAALGRPGTVSDTDAAVAAARAADLTNLNLDLMYGLPGQSLETWLASLRRVLDLGPPHISCYALTIEEGTTLAQQIARREVPAPDESLQIAMEAAAEDLLTEAGYRRYEISNYAKPGWECRHNLRYWTGQDYLGLGPSAQSYVDGVRFGVVPDLTAYMEELGESRLPIVDRRPLSPEDQRTDALVFGLRLTEGVPHQSVDGTGQDGELSAKVARLIGRGLLQADGHRVKLTTLGRRYADSVAGDLF
jgi:oxygen-independent coproporphyrinogen-3 oxidase